MQTEPQSGMPYTDFLAQLCLLREVRLYLEVGVQNAVNLSRIPAEAVVGVDPDMNLTVDPIQQKKMVHLYRMTSDAFFRSHHAETILAGGVDLAFLDGMHLFEYLLRDFYNTERRASPTGLIALHDCLPFDGEMIERTFDFENRSHGMHRGAWTGDVWKLVPILKEYRPDLEVNLVDCFPTGLVMISNLNPSDRVLSDRYVEIVKKWRQVSNDVAGLEAFYKDNEIVRSSDIICDNSQSTYFKH